MEDDKPSRVMRGGSWLSVARLVRVAYRGRIGAHRYSFLGLRFFHFASDLELLASPTRELSNKLKNEGINEK